MEFSFSWGNELSLGIWVKGEKEWDSAVVDVFEMEQNVAERNVPEMGFRL